MSSDSQPPMKRGRTAATDRDYQSASEELSQVANLVERRRVQNRISQRNYRNKIRSRLEKLEALVESNKQAQKEAAAAAAALNTPPPDAAAPSSSSSSSSRDALSFCKCMLEPASFLNISGTEFQPMCHCGSSKDMNQSSAHGLDHLTPVSNFLDTDGADQLYAGLGSPDGLQCHTPATMHPDHMASLSMATTMSMDQSSTASSSQPLTMLSMENQSQYPKSPFSRMAYPYPLPMGAAMVPMGFMAIPTTGTAADFAMHDGAKWTGATGHPCFPPGSTSPHHPSTPPAMAMPGFMWVPASMMMVPVPAMHPHQHMGGTPGSDTSG